MESNGKINITVKTTVNLPIGMVWKYWTNPEDITKWNSASPDWHTPNAENDLRKGGKFSYRMEAKDGSMGFDFWGIYDNVKVNELIEITLGDNRKMNVLFTSLGNVTEIVETFEAENTNSIELQRSGWQAILDNFKKYAEAK